MTDRRKLLGIILGVAIVVIAGMLFHNYNTGGDIPEGGLNFPETIQSLKLREVVSGPQAIAMISRLHGTDISIKQGYIAVYGEGKNQINIWLSESGTKKEAEELFKIMDVKIKAASASPKAPFTDRRVMTKEGKKVIAVKGMGMENYYYKSGTLVYWIAAGGVDPVKALEETLEVMP